MDRDQSSDRNSIQTPIDWIFYKDLNEELAEISYVDIEQNLLASDHALTVAKLKPRLDVFSRVII